MLQEASINLPCVSLPIPLQAALHFDNSVHTSNRVIVLQCTLNFFLDRLQHLKPPGLRPQGTDAPKDQRLVHALRIAQMRPDPVTGPIKLAGSIARQVHVREDTWAANKGGGL